MAEQPESEPNPQVAEPEHTQRQAVVEAAQALARLGLTPGRTGNASLRRARGLLITPSGVPYQALSAETIVFLDDEGRAHGAAFAPSSEWQLHLAIYRARADLAAIVHCHSPHASALACARKAIPAFHYMVSIAGGTEIPLAAYATFGTAELAAATVQALGKSYRACLLANHGQVACAATLDAALEMAIHVEALAQQYLLTLQIGGPHILDEAEMRRVADKFAHYGRPQRATSPSS